MKRNDGQMKILLNNREEDFEQEQMTVSELLAIKKYTFRMLVVKVNGVLIRRHEFDQIIVRNGDDVMVLHLITGG